MWVHFSIDTRVSPVIPHISLSVELRAGMLLVSNLFRMLLASHPTHVHILMCLCFVCVFVCAGEVEGFKKVSGGAFFPVAEADFGGEMCCARAVRRAR